MLENKVKNLLAEGRTAWGAALPIASDLVAKMTVNTGIDFLWIDTEHVPYGVEAIEMVPIICRMKGCVPLVRVAGLDPVLIKKALDIGAGAVMIPQINNAEEARLAVQYTKYPPQGNRGVSPTWTFYLDIPYDDYLPVANDETSVVVQIETLEGIRNLEKIAEVEGVDVVFAGPMDLSAALGHIGQVGHPEVQRFLEQFPERVAQTKKHSGIASAGVDNPKRYHDLGYRFISIGHLLLQGVQGLSADLKKLKQLTDT